MLGYLISKSELPQQFDYKKKIVKHLQKKYNMGEGEYKEIQPTKKYHL